MNIFLSGGRFSPTTVAPRAQEASFWAGRVKGEGYGEGRCEGEGYG